MVQGAEPFWKEMQASMEVDSKDEFWSIRLNLYVSYASLRPCFIQDLWENQD